MKRRSTVAVLALVLTACGGGDSKGGGGALSCQLSSISQCNGTGDGGNGATNGVTNVAPLKAALNQTTTFTVTGTGLSNNLSFSLSNCDNVTALAGGTDTQRQFSCKPRVKGTATGRVGNFDFNVAVNEVLVPAMVAISGRNYEIGKYEVTQTEWESVMGSNPSYYKNCPTCPVEQVSWNDIQTYLEKLNEATGKDFRLPEESEWEYACYGGSTTTFCGGEDADAVAWWAHNSDIKTAPVGQKQANGYGLYDMSGNVWEWQQNWYDSNQLYRTLRGGAWYDSYGTYEASVRHFDAPIDRNDGYGFRIVRTLP